MRTRGIKTFSVVVAWVAACAVLTAPLPVNVLAGGAERGADAVVLLNGARQANIEITLNTGSLWVAGGTMATGTVVGSTELLRARFDPQDAGKPALEYRVSGDGQTGHLRLAPGQATAEWAWTQSEAAWRLYLNPMVPTNLDVDLGTGSTELVLGGLLINSVDVTAGSGDVVLDLSGDWRQSMSGSVDIGAGDLTILVSRNTGVRMTVNQASGELVSGPFEAQATELTNAAYGQTETAIDLSIELGAGDITLVEV